jgi:hypothetical protein
MTVSLKSMNQMVFVAEINLFPVRYKMNLYILCRENSAFKELNGNKSDLDEDTAAVRDYSNMSRSTDKIGSR